MKNIEKECIEFCKVLGSDNWGPFQTCSIKAAFYAGALVSFYKLTNISDNKNEDIAVTQIDNLLLDINIKIKEQQKIMVELMDQQ